MAYDASNNKDDQSMVAGPTPLSQGASTPVANPTPESNSANPTPTPIVGTSSTEATSQGPTQNTKSKASSGMFTNIQKYVDKNRPQAQKISSAVTQDVGNQASEIRQQAEQKTAQTRQQLAANQSAIDEQRQFAQNQVNAIMNAQAPQQPQKPEGIPPIQQAQESMDRVPQQFPMSTLNPYEVEQENAKKFQQLMQGDLQGINPVQGINLAQQQSKAQALQNLAGGVRTEQGRRNLLANTFENQGQYTRGMSGLDQLILSGDDTARTGLIQGIQDQAGTLSNDLTGIESDVRNQIADQGRTFDNFGNEITNLAQGNVENIDNQMEQAYQTALQERQALLDPTSAEYQAAAGGAQARLDELDAILGDQNAFLDYAKQFSGVDETGGHRPSHNLGLNRYMQNLREFENTGTINASIPMVGDTILSGRNAQTYLDQGLQRLSHDRERKQIRNFYDQLNRNIIGEDPNDLYGLKGINIGSTNETLKDFLGNTGQLKKNYQALGSADDIIQRRLEKEGDTTYENLLKGGDISKYAASDRDQINRFNALKRLMGREDIIADEMIDQDGYLSQDQLKSLLARYNR